MQVAANVAAAGRPDSGASQIPDDREFLIAEPSIGQLTESGQLYQQPQLGQIPRLGRGEAAGLGSHASPPASIREGPWPRSREARKAIHERCPTVFVPFVLPLEPSIVIVQ